VINPVLQDVCKIKNKGKQEGSSLISPIFGFDLGGNNG